MDPSVPINEFITKQWKEGETLFVGLQGIQGSGKSTVCAKIAEMQTNMGKKVLGVSLDDFYLTRSQLRERENIYALKQSLNDFNKEVGKKPGPSTIYQGRGLAGTHDTTLLKQTLKSLSKPDISNRTSISVPVYDKSAYNGEGDRQDEWRKLDLPIDLVIVEGWMLGFKSTSMETLKKRFDENGGEDRMGVSFEDIVELNRNMETYDDIWELFDVMVYLCAPSLSCAYEWRWEQEQELWRKKGKGMTEDQVKKFVDRFMPSYLMYLNQDDQVRGKLALLVQVDKNHKVIADLSIK